jgi:hypothetical protein
MSTHDALMDRPGWDRPMEVPYRAHHTCLEVAQYLGEPVSRQPDRVLEPRDLGSASSLRIFLHWTPCTKAHLT